MENNNLINSAQIFEPTFVKENPCFEMTKRDNMFLIFLLLFTIPFVSLTLWGGFNLGFTLSVLIFTLVYSIYFEKPQSSSKLFPALCLFLLLCCSLAVSLTTQPAVRFWLILTVFILLGMWLAYLGGYDLSDDYSLISAYFVSTFSNMFGSMGRSIKTIFSLKGGKKLLKVLISILCALPMLSIVVKLLRSGDAAFEGLLDYIGRYLNGTGGTLLKIITGVLVFPFLLSLCLGLKKNRRLQKKWYINVGLDDIYIISFLSMFFLVYLIYLFSQFAYFFSAFAGILPRGITVATYARRGFFEMTVIAAINFVLIVFASIFCRKNENNKRNKVITVFITFIGIFTLILISTAVSKMLLYIQSFGMTRLRILTSAFMLFLAVLFIAIILRSFIKKVPVIKTGIIAAAVILAVLGFADVDKNVAKYNLYAYENGYTESLDVTAIGDLGEGGIPTLYEIYSNKNLDVTLRVQAKTELNKACEKMYTVKTVDGKKQYIRDRELGDFNLSSHRAYKALNKFLRIE